MAGTGEQDRIDLKLSQEAALTADAWRTIQGVTRVSAQNGTLTVLAEDSDVVLPRLFESAPSLGVHINAVEVQEQPLHVSHDAALAPRPAGVARQGRRDHRPYDG